MAKELTNQGHKVIVITAKINNSDKTYEIVDNIEIYRFPSIRLPKLSITLNFPWISWTLTRCNIKRFDKIVKKYNPDIIHLHNHMFDLALSAVFIQRKYKIPLIITVHTIVQHPIRIYHTFLHIFDRFFLKNFIVDRADRIICPEKTIFEYVKKTFGNKKLEIIPYGIEKIPEGDIHTCRNIIEKYNLSDKKIFLSLGHVHEIRDRKDIIQAMPNIIKVIPNFVLVIVGDIGTDKPRILAKNLGVEKNVIFTGPVSHSMVPSFLAISDIVGQWFHVSNPQSKTLGIAALEAMSARKTVIGTADPDVYGENILISGYNVILIKKEDPEQLSKLVIELLDNDTLRNQIGENASRTIDENFSWISVCERTIKLYHIVISENRADHG